MSPHSTKKKTSKREYIENVTIHRLVKETGDNDNISESTLYQNKFS